MTDLSDLRKGVEVEIESIQDQMAGMDKASDEYKQLSEAYVQQLDRLHKFEQLDLEDAKREDSQTNDCQRLELETKRSKWALVKDVGIFLGGAALSAGAYVLSFYFENKDAIYPTSEVGKESQRQAFQFWKKR